MYVMNFFIIIKNYVELGKFFIILLCLITISHSRMLITVYKKEIRNYTINRKDDFLKEGYHAAGISHS